MKKAFITPDIRIVHIDGTDILTGSPGSPKQVDIIPGKNNDENLVTAPARTSIFD